MDDELFLVIRDLIFSSMRNFRWIKKIKTYKTILVIRLLDHLSVRTTLHDYHDPDRYQRSTVVILWTSLLLLQHSKWSWFIPTHHFSGKREDPRLRGESWNLSIVVVLALDTHWKHPEIIKFHFFFLEVSGTWCPRPLFKKN